MAEYGCNDTIEFEGVDIVENLDKLLPLCDGLVEE